jgi:cytoplasmic iron level regulating protein YaaA (DUF328/UPF0246 family)
MVILLPPSVGKAAGGQGGRSWTPAGGRFGVLAPLRLRVARALARARGGNAKLLGANGDLLDRCRAANRVLVGSPTLPAWQRFTGVVWDALDPSTLSREGRRQARTSVVVVSAVTGLSGWSDPVPDFRLKLSASLSPLGRLDAFWRAPLSAALNERLVGRIVIDLLPQEHRAAWIPDAGVTIVRPELTTADDRPGGHEAKATKGRLVRALLEAGDDDLDDTLARFDPGPLRLTITQP